MKLTKLEYVERTYCDICKRDITSSGSYGYYDNNGYPVDICTNGRMFPTDKSCEQKFKFNRGFIAGDIDFD